MIGYQGSGLQCLTPDLFNAVAICNRIDVIFEIESNKKFSFFKAQGRLWNISLNFF